MSKSEDYPPSGSPLHMAVCKNNYRLAENLIMRGANVNAMGHYSLWGRCKVNCSPLHVAVDLKNTAIVQLLLKYKANVNTRTSSGETALYIAAMAAIHDNDEIIEMLIEAGADVNFSSNRSLLSTTLFYTKSAITCIFPDSNMTSFSVLAELLFKIWMSEF